MSKRLALEYIARSSVRRPFLIPRKRASERRKVESVHVDVATRSRQRPVLDAAHAAADKWGRIAVAERARILNRIAVRIEEYLPFLAAVETYDNGKPIRETNLADLPLAVDHFRYFASCIRAQEGSLGELDDDTVASHDEKRHGSLVAPKCLFF